MDPLNRLSLAWKVFNDLSCPNEDGSDDVKLLLNTAINVNKDNDPKDEGIEPMREFCCRESRDMVLNPPRKLGIVPVTLFPSICNATIALNKDHCDGIDPEKLLNRNRNAFRLTAACSVGKEPVKEFESI
eukprot:gene12599-biopygen6178